MWLFRKLKKKIGENTYEEKDKTQISIVSWEISLVSCSLQLGDKMHMALLYEEVFNAIFRTIDRTKDLIKGNFSVLVVIIIFRSGDVTEEKQTSEDGTWELGRSI